MKNKGYTVEYIPPKDIKAEFLEIFRHIHEELIKNQFKNIIVDTL